MRRLLVVAVIMLAGCADVEPTVPEVHEEPVMAAPTIENRTVTPPDPALQLVDLSAADLRQAAAAATIPQGTYGIVRWIMTPDFYEGDASQGSYQWAIHVEGPEDGVVMLAEGRVSPFDASAPVEPRLQFRTVADWWMGTSGSFSCTGCESPARSQYAVLAGSPDGDVTIRFGIGTWNAPTLLDREQISIEADALTLDAWAGQSYYRINTGAVAEWSSGVVQVERDAVAPAPTSGNKNTRWSLDGNMSSPGVFALNFRSSEAAGLDTWSFDVSGSASAATNGRYLHATSMSNLQTLADLTQSPRATIQLPVPAGTLTVAGEREFTGAEDPLSAPYLGTYEALDVGYAGVDLDMLYGWDVQQTTPAAAELGYHETIDVFTPAL